MIGHCDFSPAADVAAVHERSAQLNIITHTHNAYANMKILQAIGLGVAIIVLKLLMGPTFSAFESTLRVFFLFVQEVLQRLAHASISGGGTGAAMF